MGPETYSRRPPCKAKVPEGRISLAHHRLSFESGRPACTDRLASFEDERVRRLVADRSIDCDLLACLVYFNRTANSSPRQMSACYRLDLGATLSSASCLHESIRRALDDDRIRLRASARRRLNSIETLLFVQVAMSAVHVASAASQLGPTGGGQTSQATSG
jgi:hypothetical protein